MKTRTDRVAWTLYQLDELRRDGYIVEYEYQRELNKLCNEYGTEHIADIMIDLGLGA